MTGNSTWGSGATGSIRYATMPASSSATLSRVVATGRWMNGPEMFTSVDHGLDGLGRPRPGPAEAAAEAIEGQIDDRRRVERQQLREEQAADDRDAERPP